MASRQPPTGPHLRTRRVPLCSTNRQRSVGPRHDERLTVMSSMSSTPADNAVTPVRVWVASPAGCRTLASAAEAARLAGGGGFTWIDLEETGDAGSGQISEVLDLGA